MSTDCCAKCFEMFNASRTFYERKSSASENGQVFRVSPKHKAVCCIKVDDGIIPKDGGQSRCDYLFVINSNGTNKFLFIELKGKGVNGEDAAKQLFDTIDLFLSKYESLSLDDEIYGFIIGGNATTQMAKEKSIFAKKYNGLLYQKSGGRKSYEFQ